MTLQCWNGLIRGWSERVGTGWNGARATNITWRLREVRAFIRTSSCLAARYATVSQLAAPSAPGTRAETLGNVVT